MPRTKGFFHSEATRLKMQGRRASTTISLLGNRNSKRYNYFTIPAGYSKHPLYSTYYSMMNRCYNPNDHQYAYFGAKGIKVVDRWTGPNGFLNFIADVKAKPVKLNSRGRNLYTFSIKDRSRDYGPDNYLWSYWTS